MDRVSDDMDRVSDDELAAAMAANYDADGNDLSLIGAERAMTPEQRAQSHANARAFAAELRATLRPLRRASDDASV
jgi:hypothetical protein